MIYRMSFDFSTASAMRDFLNDFQAMTLQPDGNDFRNTELVHHDSLHDRQKVIHCLVRQKSKGGNGRPVAFKDTHTEWNDGTSVFECKITSRG
jgi:hypothetical protein